MKARKSLVINLSFDDVRAINDTRHLLENIKEEIDNELVYGEKYTVDAKNIGWSTIPKEDFETTVAVLGEIYGLKELYVQEVD